MVSEQQATYSLNIGLHILILFTFLTVFFFIIISKTEKKSINRQLDKVINQGAIDNALDKLLSIQKKYPQFKIEWKSIYESAQQISAKSQGIDPKINSENKRLEIVGLVIIGTIAILLVCMYLYYRFALQIDVDLWHIFSENAIIFLFIGAIEYIFFMEIASNYVPVTSSYVTNSILARLKERIQDTLTHFKKAQ